MPTNPFVKGFGGIFAFVRRGGFSAICYAGCYAKCYALKKKEAVKRYRRIRNGWIIFNPSKGNGRCWKEVFEFNGKFYLVVSQWQKFNRERFNNWLNTLEN